MNMNSFLDDYGSLSSSEDDGSLKDQFSDSDEFDLDTI